MGDVRRRWVRWVAPAELVGFAAPASTAVVLADRDPTVLLVALVAAGAVEGAALGWAQAHVLRRLLPALQVRRWLLGTVAGACVAYLVGMAGPTWPATWAALPVPLVVALVAVGAVVLLASIGVGQWWELRRHVPRAGRWVAATALAWCLGLAAFTAVTAPLWQPGQAPVVLVAVGVLGGAVMAVVMAAVTAEAVVRVVLPVSVQPSAAAPRGRRRAPGPARAGTAR